MAQRLTRPAPPGTCQPMPGRTLRVLTLNCWNISPPFEERMALVRREILELEPDVIGLQEVIVRPDGFDQGAVILEHLGYHSVFGASFRWTDAGDLVGPSEEGHGFGNLVAARWRIVATAVEFLPGGSGMEQRSALGTVIETPAGHLAFVTTHLEWRFDQGHVRERQAVAVDAFVRRLARDTPLPPVLTGDLNAEPDATEIRFLRGLTSLDDRSTYFQDAWARAGTGGPGFTWDNRNRYAALMFEPSRRIDYVLVGLADREGRGWIEAARVVMDRPSGQVFASDHFGVVADVRMLSPD